MTLVLFLSRSPIRKPPTGRMGILDFLFKDNQRDTEVLHQNPASGFCITCFRLSIFDLAKYPKTKGRVQYMKEG